MAIPLVRATVDLSNDSSVVSETFLEILGESGDDSGFEIVFMKFCHDSELSEVRMISWKKREMHCVADE